MEMIKSTVTSLAGGQGTYRDLEEGKEVGVKGRFHTGLEYYISWV